MKLYHGSNNEAVFDRYSRANNMQAKYFYKEQDITTDIMFKIEHIVSIITEKEKTSFEMAYLNFLNSNTYKILQKTSSLMWAESAEFIVDEYYREKDCG